MDYAVTGALIGAALISYAARVRRVHAVICAGGGGLTTPAPRLVTHVAIEALVALRDACALTALMPDFVLRDRLPRAFIARTSLMSGRWWAHALCILSGCAVTHLWASSVSARR